MRTNKAGLIILIISVVEISAQVRQGSICKLANGGRGKCKPITDCLSAARLLQEKEEWPELCDDSETVPIVCCDEADITTTTTTTPAPPRRASNAKLGPGVISRMKCDEYSRWMKSLVSLGLNDEWVAGQCGAKVATFIFGGVQAAKLEFPHMAHLGFSQGGTDEDDITWECGGSLISRNFVLTAAHCVRNRNRFNVSHVRLGHGDVSSTKVFEVIRTHVYPSYSPKTYYDDIALLQLKTNVEFNDYRRPACLHNSRRLTEKQGTASGWGNTEMSKSGSNVLLKVDLPFMNETECSKIYRNNIRLTKGIDDRTQFCAGGMQGKDTCQGDSGGPLQVVLKKPPCMYSVVGLTSFGAACGATAGVYTRVSTYVPWIEKIVWPQNG